MTTDSCFEDKDLTEQDETWIDVFKTIPALQPLEPGEIVKVYPGTPTPEAVDPKEQKKQAKKLKRQQERAAAKAEEEDEEEEEGEENPKPKKVSRSERAFKRKLSGAAAGVPSAVHLSQGEKRNGASWRSEGGILRGFRGCCSRYQKLPQPF